MKRKNAKKVFRKINFKIAILNFFEKCSIYAVSLCTQRELNDNILFRYNF